MTVFGGPGNPGGGLGNPGGGYGNPSGNILGSSSSNPSFGAEGQISSLRTFGGISSQSSSMSTQATEIFGSGGVSTQPSGVFGPGGPTPSFSQPLSSLFSSEPKPTPYIFATTTNTSESNRFVGVDPVSTKFGAKPGSSETLFSKPKDLDIFVSEPINSQNLFSKTTDSETIFFKPSSSESLFSKVPTNSLFKSFGSTAEESSSGIFGKKPLSFPSTR